MINAHILDRPVWSSLTTRQVALSLGDAKAKRLAPDYGVFAATVDRTPESLVALAALSPKAALRRWSRLTTRRLPTASRWRNAPNVIR